MYTKDNYVYICSLENVFKNIGALLCKILNFLRQKHLLLHLLVVFLTALQIHCNNLKGGVLDN